jgi:hypothetical protein
MKLLLTRQKQTGGTTEEQCTSQETGCAATQFMCLGQPLVSHHMHVFGWVGGVKNTRLLTGVVRISGTGGHLLNSGGEKTGK